MTAALSRRAAADLADDEVRCLHTHLSNLANLAGPEGGMVELAPVVDRLHGVLTQLGEAIAASRRARVQ